MQTFTRVVKDETISRQACIKIIAGSAVNSRVVARFNFFVV